jgi:hypothetical protein
LLVSSTFSEGSSSPFTTTVLSGGASLLEVAAETIGVTTTAPHPASIARFGRGPTGGRFELAEPLIFDPRDGLAGSAACVFASPSGQRWQCDALAHAPPSIDPNTVRRAVEQPPPANPSSKVLGPGLPGDANVTP